MKELSIEEKARRYDEAIERANNLHKDAVEMENNMTTKTCEIIFPELKESEGERIRNFISNELACLRAADEKGTVRYNELTEAIAWLEKQGEPQPKQEWSEENEKEVAVLEAYIYSRDWSERHIDRALSIVDELVKKLKSLRSQTTWKPSDEHYELEKFAKIVRGNLTGISKAVQKLFEAKYLQLTGNKMYGGFKD